MQRLHFDRIARVIAVAQPIQQRLEDLVAAAFVFVLGDDLHAHGRMFERLGQLDHAVMALAFREIPLGSVRIDGQTLRMSRLHRDRTVRGRINLGGCRMAATEQAILPMGIGFADQGEWIGRECVQRARCNRENDGEACNVSEKSIGHQPVARHGE